MLMVRAIIRPEKCDAVLSALMEAGFPAVTKLPVFGRGKQRGLRVGAVQYDELPKEMLIVVIPEKDREYVIQTIIQTARTGKGAFGDGKIFVSEVAEVYTISSGLRETDEAEVAQAKA